MGQVVSTQRHGDHYSSDLQWVVFSANMNKFLAIACLAAVAVAKPEAEADPALLYGAYGYAGLGHIGYPYAYGYAGYPYAAAGYASYSPSASTHIAGVAPAALPALAGGYAGAGRYVANSAGVVHVVKREAKAEPNAEADAGLLYGAYGYGAGLGYAGYGGYGLGYGRLGYAGLGYYGKRSADAEPEADAGLYYGGYGYGAGLGYSGLGYGYSGLGYAGYGGYGLGYGGYGLGYGRTIYG